MKKLEDELYFCLTLCGQAEDRIEKLLLLVDSQRQSKSDSWDEYCYICISSHLLTYKVIVGYQGPIWVNKTRCAVIINC